MGDELIEGVWSELLDKYGPDGAMGELFSRWAEADRTPLVLLIDEIDSLVGVTLISVLRQLRAGYDRRPGSFPQSVVLCGVRDVRDYRMRSIVDGSVIAGGGIHFDFSRAGRPRPCCCAASGCEVQRTRLSFLCSILILPAGE